MPRIRWEMLMCVCLLCVLPARAAWAQKEKPPGPFAIDVRGAFVSFSPTDAIAAPFKLTKTQMPARGFGTDIGARVYVLRKQPVTIGLGASWLNTSGKHVPDPTLAPKDPTMKEKFSALSTEVSLNFGSSNGWSYISGGVGTARRSIELTPAASTTGTTTTTTTSSTSTPTPVGRREKAINYGGGARWFASPHIAFGFDLRWYAINPAPPSATMLQELPRQTLFVANVGISIH
jgi:hypothetical protein